MTDETTRRHVRIRGDVQGVFFRDTCRREAERLGVAGWVRNDGDGSVEAVFEGDPAAVDELVEWCTRGPDQAVVEDVGTETQSPVGETGFSVR